MKASEFMDLISEQIKVYGDLPICGGNISDDTGVKSFDALNKDGCAIIDGYNGPPVEFFIE